MFADFIRFRLFPDELFRSAIGAPPDAWQSRVLRGRWKRALVCKPRQVGGSAVAAVLAVHEARFRPGSLVVLVAPTQRQSAELHRAALSALRAIGEDGLDVAVESESAMRVELRNGSRVVALPGGNPDGIRGYSAANLVVVDEAARVSDDLLGAVGPMLAVSRGRLLALSTPNGRRGFFWRAWSGELGEWERFSVRAQDCPRLDPVYLEAERVSMGESMFLQEWGGPDGPEFREAEDAVFAEAMIASLVSYSIEPVFEPGSAWVLPAAAAIDVKRLEAADTDFPIENSLGSITVER